MTALRAAFLAFASAVLATGAAAAPLRVRTNEAIAPCVRPVVEAFSRETGVPAVLDVGTPDPPLGAALVIGDDSEMTRILEGGRADVRSAIDLGYLPWVTVAPPGAQVRALASVSGARVAVLGGPAGRVARESLGGLAPGSLIVSRDPAELSSAAYALVPRSLAGPGEHARADVMPLVATAAVVVATPQEADARRLLAFLQGPRAHAMLGACLDPVSAAVGGVGVAAPYATAVADWWLPACSLARNRYNNASEVVGTPDALNLGGRDNYRGLMSLGQGGWVVVDMGAVVTNGPGADVRIYQATSNEEVTVYASASASGPFTLLGLREPCGRRGLGTFSNFCEFDLAAGPLAEARYIKIEDGEIYPCLSGDTQTEGADIDAVQALNFR
ncbi:MAG TPA: hypothetical protein VFQ51_03375 [Vicinamibacteria bacterium]|nr:hypothetical protein [Vicinamibacteria bacterium]